MSIASIEYGPRSPNLHRGHGGDHLAYIKVYSVTVMYDSLVKAEDGGRGSVLNGLDQTVFVTPLASVLSDPAALGETSFPYV